MDINIEKKLNRDALMIAKEYSGECFGSNNYFGSCSSFSLL